MKTKLIIPESDFAFAAGSFNLVIEQTTDGERLAREQSESRLNRQLAAEAQLAIPLVLDPPTS